MREPDDEHPGPGLRDDAPPRPSIIGMAFGLGVLWGLFGYAVLWEGVPFTVGRPFVSSAGGTVVLLPVRTVLWGIHRAELLAGRTFDLSRTNWWIAPAAGAVGAAIALAVALTARAILRRLRAPSAPGFDTRR